MPAFLPRRPHTRPHRAPGRLGPAARLLLLAGVLLIASAEPALAQAGHTDPTLSAVLDRARLVLVGLLVGLATLVLTYAGVRYSLAASDPEQVDKAKRGVKAAAVGYGLAALAPPLVGLLKWVIGV